MSVVIYFSMMGLVVLFGFLVLGLTFRQWYIESRDKKGPGEI